MRDLTRVLSNKNDENASLRTQLATLQQENQDLKRKLGEARKAMEAKNSCISFLKSCCLCGETLNTDDTDRISRTLASGSELLEKGKG